MDRITMAFGPISDVTGFSHKAGMTYLEIQEALREKINELVAAHKSLVSHIEGRNGDLQSAFDSAMENLSVPVAEYANLAQQTQALIDQLTPFVTASTDYITAT